MENNNQITKIMHEHHLKISKLLVELENALKSNNYDEIEKTFSEFKINLEKHFFEEESVIFKFCEKLSKDKVEISMSLMQEHRTMLNMLNVIESDIKNKREVNDSDFKKMHINHMNTEEITFYPNLDISLTQEEKYTIVKEIESLS
jgi:hypothetical protein